MKCCRRGFWKKSRWQSLHYQVSSVTDIEHFICIQDFLLVCAFQVNACLVEVFPYFTYRAGYKVVASSEEESGAEDYYQMLKNIEEQIRKLMKFAEEKRFLGVESL